MGAWLCLLARVLRGPCRGAASTGERAGSGGARALGCQRAPCTRCLPGAVLSERHAATALAGGACLL